MAKKKEGAVEEITAPGETICGVKRSDIKAAYFKGKVKQLLGEIMTKHDVTEEDAAELENYLLELRGSEENLVGRLIDVFGGKIVGQEIELKPPSVGDLYDDPQAKENFDAWRVEVGEAVARIKFILRAVNNVAKNKSNVKPKDYMDFAHELVYLMGYAGEYRTYLEQKYRKKLIEFVDSNEYKCSRAEAEERARITPEYRDFKNAETLMVQLDNIIMNCKKEFGEK